MITAVLIDDDRDNLTLLEKKLKLLQVPVAIAGSFTSATEAIEFIESTPPDLIITDINMPELTGLELVQHIHHLAVPVIFLTAYEDFALKALKLSAIDYLLKPVDATELKQALNKVLELKDKSLVQITQQHLLEFNQRQKTDTLVINTQERAVVLKIIDIIQIEAKQSYSVISDNHGNTVTSSKPIQYYHELLKDLGFFRSHRSFLINKNQIAEVMKDGTVLMRNGFKAVVSKENLSGLIADLGMK